MILNIEETLRKKEIQSLLELLITIMQSKQLFATLTRKISTYQQLLLDVIMAGKHWLCCFYCWIKVD